MGTIQIDGATPKLTIGNATAEDATILFDGNAQDFYIALDDSADDLLIGLGSSVGTTPVIAIDENKLSTFSGAVTVGVDDTGHDVKFFGATASSHMLWDESADDLNLIASGLGVGTAKDLGTGVHVRTSDSGATVNANFDEFVAESSGNAGLSILTATDGYAGICFGDSGDNQIGSVIYNHGDNSMQINTSASVGIRIEGDGAVTKPRQPYVYAFANANQTLDADDADKTVALNAELKDTNADFNVSNYTFTAPVTGAYLVNGFYRFTGDTAAQATDWFLKFTASNGAESVWSGNPSVWETSSASAYSKSVNVSKTIYMDASDTLTMTTDVYSGGSYTYVIDGNANSYSATSMQITLLC